MTSEPVNAYPTVVLLLLNTNVLGHTKTVIQRKHFFQKMLAEYVLEILSV